MGRKKLPNQDKVKNKFIGCFVNGKQYEWISNKSNISKYIRDKVLEEYEEENEDNEENEDKK